MNLYNGNRLTEIMLEYRGRHHFDPANKQDCAAFKFFLENSKWKDGKCPFVLEYPYLDIPTMVHNKLSKHMLKVA